MNRHCELGRASEGVPRLARRRMGGPPPGSLHVSGGRSLFLWLGRARAGLVTRAATHPFVRRAQCRHVGPQISASQREQSEGADRRSRAVRGDVLGDLSRCPRARALRSTPFGLVPARTGGAHAVALPPRHAEGACCGVPRVAPTRLVFALRGRAQACRQRSPAVAGAPVGGAVVAPARGSAACRVCAHHPPPTPRRPPPYPTRAASLARADRLARLCDARAPEHDAREGRQRLPAAAHAAEA